MANEADIAFAIDTSSTVHLQLQSRLHAQHFATVQLVNWRLREATASEPLAEVSTEL
jgi:hypothetical protein